MDLQRVNEMLSKKEKVDVFYHDRPVWVQEVHNNLATVGFIDNNEEKEIAIQDLYEKQ